MASFVTPIPCAFRSIQNPTVSRHRPRRPKLRSCAQIPEPPRPADVRALLTSKGKAEQQKGLLLVRQLPPQVALDLLKLSVETSDNEFIRSTAAISIGQLPFEDEALATEAVRVMSDLLATDNDYSVRAAAAAAVGYATELPEFGKSALFDALMRALLEDSEWQVHFSCLASLGSLRDERAIPVLRKWLDAKNDLLVQASIGALGDLGAISAVADLLQLLGSKDMMTRQRLAQALGQMSDAKKEPSVIDALRTLSKDQSFAVRDAALESLERFGCASPVKTETRSDEELIEAEVSNLMKGDEAGSAVESASDALRRRLERSFDKEYVQTDAHIGSVREAGLRDMDAYSKLVDELKAGNPLSQVMAAIQLRKYDGKLAAEAVVSSNALDPQTSSERLRAISVGLLARGGDMERVIDVLKTDPDQNVRSACCDALLDLGGGPSAIATCIETFENDSHWLVRISAAITLGTIGKGNEEVEDVLIQSLKANGVKGLNAPQDTVLHRHVVTALGFLGSKKALKSFEELLSNEDTGGAVRYRIAAALRGIHCEESIVFARLLIDDEDESVAEMAQGSLDALAQHDFE
ncbi:hypothetical protein BWQ96_07969 [Gracilariopsis chorda]|uniref:Uncharacterized protein n=1 Tax=Gracilariopsis chorda TaxID=448386 RepID=A0A2V3IJR0_9FLOR|nr:hypothetical protein BWQ96_07969 [Gracilariopsis chorda]|eukprot:PXF42334.1 hypothetical protein BWQ96_07969 [Gracilariopsis chorda]